MRTAWIIFAFLSIAAGILGTLFVVGLLVAGMPNSTPKQLRTLSITAWASAGAGLVIAVAAGVALYYDRPVLAVVFGLLPVVGFVLFIAIALLLS
ncbi:MAG: hypothetical protein H7144_12775 [Burkholderiales bacterium]|nr:hypothetical protein [Phycisphaerae bacterium]